MFNFQLSVSIENINIKIKPPHHSIRRNLHAPHDVSHAMHISQANTKTHCFFMLRVKNCSVVPLFIRYIF
jgi:hypothetical protein